VHSIPEQGQRAFDSSSTGWWLLLVGVLTALLCVPFFRTVFGMGSDEAVLLNGAERMLGGGRLYVDFFEFLPPGGFVLTAAWFSIFGISIGSARALAILTIVGIACFTYLACRQASKNAPLSALLATVWVVMSQGALTQVSHHWFTTLFSMVTVWAAFTNVECPQRGLRWPTIAGIAAGMAVTVTPHRGALVMLAAVTAFLNPRRHRTELITYVLGCMLVPAGLLAYVARHCALTAAFDDVIVFTATRYATIQSVPFGFEGYNDPLDYLFPVAFSLTLLVCVPNWRTCLRDPLFSQCAAFGLVGFFGCFPRPDITHIAFAAPLVCPLLASCMTQLTQRWRSAWWRYRYVVVTVAGIVVGVCVPSLIFFVQLSQAALRTKIVPTPRGGVTIFGPIGSGGPELLARIASTPPQDLYFFYPMLSKVAFLAGREKVSKYDVFMPGYTLPSQYQDACISVMRHASWVIIDHRWTETSVLKQWFPAMPDAGPQEIQRFEQALNRGFEFFAQEGAFEVRRRREGVSDVICGGIAEVLLH
jgi:hypothetical protein